MVLGGAGDLKDKSLLRQIDKFDQLGGRRSVPALKPLLSQNVIRKQSPAAGLCRLTYAHFLSKVVATGREAKQYLGSLRPISLSPSAGRSYNRQYIRL